MKQYWLSSLILASLFTSLTSLATPLTDYNLVVLGDLNGNVHVEGRTFIGGNLNVTNAADLATDSNLVLSNSLSVVGDINESGSIIKVMNGDVVYGGSVNANLEVHRGQARQDNSLSISTIADELIATSTHYAGLSANGVLETTPGSFNRTLRYSGSEATAIFNLNADEIFTANNGLNLSAGAANTVIINVSGNDVGFGGNGFNLVGDFISNAENIVWNFVDASNITINTNVWGSVLALGARVSNTGHNVDGAFASQSYVAIHTNEFHQVLFNPPEVSVNEPSPITLLLLGFGLLSLAAKRRYICR